MGWCCFCVPSYKRALGFLVVPALLFYILVAISALDDVPGIYIESITAAVGSGNVEVRVGYFGICLKSTASAGDISLSCIAGWNDYSPLLDLSKSSKDTNSVAAKLLQFASNMQHNIFVGSPAFFPGAGILFLLSLLLLIPLEWIAGPKSNARPTVVLVCNHITITMFWLAAAWSFASALSTIEAVLAQGQVVQIDGSNVKVQIGMAVQGLQWAAFFCTAFFAAGMTGLRISQGRDIRGLSRRARADWVYNSANMTSGSPIHPLQGPHPQTASYPVADEEDLEAYQQAMEHYPTSPLSPDPYNHYPTTPGPQKGALPEDFGFHRASSFPISPPAFRINTPTAPYPLDSVHSQTPQPFRRNTLLQSYTYPPTPHPHQSPTPMPLLPNEYNPPSRPTLTLPSSQHQSSLPQINVYGPTPPPDTQANTHPRYIPPLQNHHQSTSYELYHPEPTPYPDNPPPRYQTIAPGDNAPFHELGG